MFFIGHVHQANFVGLQKALAPVRSNPHEWRVLASLQENDGQTINHLAHQTVTERTYLSKIIAGMAQRKLVRRAPDDKDKRTVRIFLTDNGRTQFTALRPIVLKRYAILLDGMPKALRTQFMRALRIASRNLEGERTGKA
jgi:DNA-binding MarR family transcriptional regulator